MRHTSDEKKDVAERGTILLTQVGSGVHGTTIASTDDRDEMGLCVEPERFVLGLRTFEQYIYRTAAERTGNPDARSQAGDLDLTVYSLRKWMRLALAGNPTVLTPLFVPREEVVTMNAWGADLRAIAPEMIISRQVADRYIGYLRGQRARMLNGTVGKRVNRPELIEKYGFDTKFAGHMVRLGLQGVELMETGTLTLPMAEPWRTWIVELREGKHTQQEATDIAADLEARLLELRRSSDLPQEPDRDRADRWLAECYQEMWARMRAKES